MTTITITLPNGETVDFNHKNPPAAVTVAEWQDEFKTDDGHGFRVWQHKTVDAMENNVRRQQGQSQFVAGSVRGAVVVDGHADLT